MFTAETSLLKVRHLAFYVNLISRSHVGSAAKRLNCVKIIEPGAIVHDGPHIHTNEEQPFHYCESR